MLEELQLRNYAQNTIRHYLRAVEDLLDDSACSPDRLGPRHSVNIKRNCFKTQVVGEFRKTAPGSVALFLHQDAAAEPGALPTLPIRKRPILCRRF